MLVLTRKSEESIHIGDNIEVVILEIRSGAVRLGIKAPREVPVVRDEVRQRASSQPASPTLPMPDPQATQPQATGPSSETFVLSNRSQLSSQLLHSFCERRRIWRTLNMEPGDP